MSTQEEKIKKLAAFTKNKDLSLHTQLVEIHEVLEEINDKEFPEMPQVSFETTNQLIKELIEKVEQPCNTTIRLILK